MIKMDTTKTTNAANAETLLLNYLNQDGFEHTLAPMGDGRYLGDVGITYRVLTEEQAEKEFMQEMRHQYDELVNRSSRVSGTFEEHVAFIRETFGRGPNLYTYHDEINLGCGYVAHMID